jgi:hypothetical protein
MAEQADAKDQWDGGYHGIGGVGVWFGLETKKPARDEPGGLLGIWVMSGGLPLSFYYDTEGEGIAQRTGSSIEYRYSRLTGDTPSGQ